MSRSSVTQHPITPWVLAVLVLVAVLGTQRTSRPDLPLGESPDFPLAERVVFISLDTLRQDHLDLYGYPRPTSPRLSAFASRCAVFDDAMSHAPYTLPSHMSMFTGLHPRAHGVRHLTDALEGNHVTLAEALRDAGFRTGAFTDGGLMRADFGFDQGFELYDDDRAPGSAEVNGFRRYGERVRHWIEQHADERFFLFVHTFDTHGPYFVEDEYRDALAGTDPVVPEGARAHGDPMDYFRALSIHDYLRPDEYGSLEELIDHYDATIRFVDEQVGELLDFMDERGLLDGAMVVITSDHGEVFLDHGMYVGHGLTLHEEEVRVPLLIKFPHGRFAGERCDDVVRLIDLFPTICAASGVGPVDVQGVDLARALLGNDPEPRIAAGVSPNLASGDDGLAGSTQYLRLRDQKYISPPAISFEQLVRRHLCRTDVPEEAYDTDADPLGVRRRVEFASQLFDLADDPSELRNLAPSRPDHVDRIRRRLQELEDDNVGRARGVAEVDYSDEDIQRLIELGYLDGPTELRGAPDKPPAGRDP